MNKSDILEFASKTVLMVLFITAAIILWACIGKIKEPVKASVVIHNEWSKSSVIYEVNIRQYTPEGTFKALEQHLPRLKAMGIDILWLMPINPIGVINRKGTLGSYYSIKDYLAVNPEYGTLEDFKNLVNKIHSLGMKVIIDWVANHTSWDNNLIKEHPDWYTHDSAGNIIAPVKDWTDVADLNYDKPGLREYMKNALLYWVKETDIDGYRCDVAGMLPVDFWNWAVPEIEKTKHLFMLAEDETPKMHDTAFDMTYSWEVYHLMNEIAKGKRTAELYDSLFKSEASAFAPDAYRMRFTSNHDENSWNGSEVERLGDAAQTFAVFSFVIPGMPLIYSGQESAFPNRIKFFDKDPVQWDDYKLGSFYTSLITLKKQNQALWNGIAGGKMEKINTNDDKEIYAFIREKESSKVFAIFNLSNKSNNVSIKNPKITGNYKNIFSGSAETFDTNANFPMKPWEYRVYVRK